MVINRNPEYFLTIAQERSISRAAEKLYVSQSSLSQYLAKLESALEVKLFDRSKSPIQLTEAGRVYQSYLESNSHLYQKLQSDLNGLNSSRSQAINIGLGTWRGNLLLPEILPTFLSQHPNAALPQRSRGHLRLRHGGQKRQPPPSAGPKHLYQRRHRPPGGTYGAG